jgi:hypothetical protein
LQGRALGELVSPRPDELAAAMRKTTPAAGIITGALAPVASVSGVHPVVVGLVAVIACNTFFLPYQSTSYLALWAGTAGKLFTHRQVVPMALAYAAWTIVAILLRCRCGG